MSSESGENRGIVTLPVSSSPRSANPRACAYGVLSHRRIKTCALQPTVSSAHVVVPWSEACTGALRSACWQKKLYTTVEDHVLAEHLVVHVPAVSNTFHRLNVASDCLANDSNYG